MRVPEHFAALARPASRRDRHTAIIRFLTQIWDFGPNEYTMLYTRPAGTEKMRAHPMRGDRARKIADVLDRHSYSTHDLYFCPNAFDRPNNQKDRALSTRYAWADIDRADPKNFRPKPNVLWETSAGSFQGIWIWRDAVPAREAESYSEAMWKLYGGDSGAWAANKLLRVPGTINHKPERNGETVRLVRFDDRARSIPDAIRAAAHSREACLVTTVDPFSHDPEIVMRRYRTRMGPSSGTFMRATRVIYHDRSAAVAAVIAKLVELGADNDEIASVLWVNVYFNAKWPGNLSELERQIFKIRGDVETGR